MSTVLYWDPPITDFLSRDFTYVEAATPPEEFSLTRQLGMLMQCKPAGSDVQKHLLPTTAVRDAGISLTANYLTSI